jgi:hypothetical protein
MRQGAARLVVVALLLVTAGLALFALQHRSTDGDLHVTTAIGALECAPDDAAPAGLAGDGHPSALAGELLLLLGLLLTATATWRIAPRILAPPRAPRIPTLPSLLLPAPGLLRV